MTRQEDLSGPSQSPEAIGPLPVMTVPIDVYSDAAEALGQPFSISYVNNPGALGETGSPRDREHEIRLRLGEEGRYEVRATFYPMVAPLSDAEVVYPAGKQSVSRLLADRRDFVEPLLFSGDVLDHIRGNLVCEMRYGKRVFRSEGDGSTTDYNQRFYGKWREMGKDGQMKPGEPRVARFPINRKVIEKVTFRFLEPEQEAPQQ